MPSSRDHARGWKPAAVPGSVQHDLWVLGEIPNPYFERNSLLSEWVCQRSWLYRKIFHMNQRSKALA
jgi:beta-mannosidase